MVYLFFGICIIAATFCLGFRSLNKNFWGLVAKYIASLSLVTAEETAPQWGTDTVSAIRAGVMTGTEWEIEGCIRAFRKEFPDAPVFLTGGNARPFCTFHPPTSKAPHRL